MNEFNPKAGAHIKKDKAKEMHEKYKKKNPGKTQSVYFGSEHFEKLTKVPGAVGIRIVNAENDDGTDTFVLYPVNEKNQIIEAEDTPIEYGQPCPPVCS
jgi:hypothetical protein